MTFENLDLFSWDHDNCPKGLLCKGTQKFLQVRGGTVRRGGEVRNHQKPPKS